MVQKGGSQREEIVHTTVGELVEAVTEIAVQAGKSEEEGYELASLTLEALLSKNRSRIDTFAN